MKSKTIELHMECHTDGNEKLADLGIESNNTEYRPCVLFVEWIEFCYPHSEGGTLIAIGSAELRFKESYEEIKKLIHIDS